MPTNETPNLEALIAAAADELKAIRHDLHAHPELGYEEHRTSALVADELKRLGLETKTGLAGGTGVVAHLPATTPDPQRPAVAFRADMDALPIHEQTGRPYASKTPGVMHACGHDGHTTTLLGAARILSQLDHRPHPVTFIFQPAEEGGGGGKRMCDDGALRGEGEGGIGQPVSRIYALHNWPQTPLGSVSTRPGPLLAATDELEIEVVGRQAHAAYPHLGADPILAASHIITALQSIVSRAVDPFESVVVTIAVIKGGSAKNVIPDRVRLEGTMRTLTPQMRELGRKRVRSIAEQAAKALGCRAEVKCIEGYPVTYNDAALTAHFMDVARDALGEHRATIQQHPTMGGEDFSYYAQHVPACFFLLGQRPEDKPTYPSLHQPDFDFNDDSMPLGIEMFCRLALA